MSEGLFHVGTFSLPHVPDGRLLGALVRVRPRTILHIDIAANQSEAWERSCNELLPCGSEIWRRYFVAEDTARAQEPGFAAGMVSHEFSQLVLAKAKFPQSVPLEGGGTGFAISEHGHVLTNYHLAIGEVKRHEREAGQVNAEVLCRSLRAEVARQEADGTWTWIPADKVWLVSNPPAERTLKPCSDGRLAAHEDTALLRIEPAPRTHLALKPRQVSFGEPLMMVGFPLRSARKQESLRRIGYCNADGTARLSRGHVIETIEEDLFLSDIGGSMGNSGSPVFDADGFVVGMFAGARGDGTKNLVDFGHVQRLHVTSKLVITGLEMQAILPLTTDG